ncbi:hypothetical protein VTO42DRAFT_5853 [Malbranchea cinnamomea]
MPHRHHKHAKGHLAKHRAVEKNQDRGEDQPVVTKGTHAKRDGILDFLDDLFGGGSSAEKSDDVEVIYVTLSPTFDGPIGGYSTEGQPPKTPPRNGIADPVERTATPTTTSKKTTTRPTRTPTRTSTETPARRTTTTATPTRTSITHTTLSTSVTDFALTSPPTLSFTETPSATATGSSSSAEGLSGGAKAGIAIGVIGAVALIAGAVFFFLRKKRGEDGEITESGNEKAFTGAGTGPTVSEPPPPPPISKVPDTAPQLNVRHVSRFAPDFGAGGGANSDSLLGVAGIAAAAGVGVAGAARNRTGQDDGQLQAPIPPPKPGNEQSNPFSDPVNPFGNHAAAPSPSSTPPTDMPAPLRVRTPSPEATSVRTVTPDNMTSGVASTGMAVAAGTVAVAAVAGKANGKPPSQEQIAPPAPGIAKDMPPGSPAIASDTASVSSAFLAGGAGPGPNNVHRVQLDFDPSMDDELELRAGQLVRLLHEYDDGWALCVRLDRSQQGVVPRTCLSARPVKPRPRGPPGPPGPAPRGPPPPGPHGRPMSPAGGRMSPAPGPLPNGQPRFHQYQNSRPSSPSTGYRPYVPPNQNSRPSSPSTGYRPYPPPGHGMQPPRFPEIPRSLSPGPGSRFPQQRSMSPGPYGPGGMEKPIMPAAQRQRSNSASGPVNRFQAPPAGPSSLRGPVQRPAEPTEAPPPVEPAQPVQPAGEQQQQPQPQEPQQQQQQQQQQHPQPAESVQPSQPVKPSEPVATQEPEPTESVQPVGPVEPTPDPASPAGPDTIPAPAEPVSTQAAEHAPTTEPAKSVESVNNEQQPVQVPRPVRAPPSLGPVSRKPVPGQTQQ